MRLVRDGGGEGARNEGPVCPRGGVQGAQDEIDMMRRLEETGCYRVLRKLEPWAIAGDITRLTKIMGGMVAGQTIDIAR